MDVELTAQFFIFQVNAGDLLFVGIRVALVIGVTLLVDQVISRLIESVGKNRGLDRRDRRQVKTSIRYFVVAFAILGLMGALGIDLTVVFAGAGIIAFAVGFAGKDLISNFLSGTFLIFEKELSVGDTVKIGDTIGMVRLITLRTTQIKTMDDNIVIVPNSTMANSIITNMTSGSKFMFTSIVIRISYDEDLNKVTTIMKNSIPDDCRSAMKEESDLKFEFQDISERYLGHTVIMYFKVEADKEPWIRSKVQAQVVKTLVEEKIEFQKEPKS